MEHSEFNAYSPKEMAQRVENAGVAKANMDFGTTLALAMLAGAFIALGALCYTLVTHHSTLSYGMSQFVGGLAFCLGLILVVIAGAELFTGNNLIVMAWVDRKITWQSLLRNWAIVYIGNFMGALIMVLLIYFSGHWQMDDVGVRALQIAVKKVNLSFGEALFRGVLCNVLVCLAVWLCFAGRSVTDKILAILFPITAFVALGFEHSVANMYFIPAGIVLGSDPLVLAAAGNPDLTHLGLVGMFMYNLIPVTLGNMIGGGLLVGGVYWFVYLRRSAD